MLDLKLIRSDPDGVREALLRRGESPPIDDVLEADERRRSIQAQLDELRADQKRRGRDVASLKGPEKGELLEELKDLSDRITALEQQLADAASDMNRLLSVIPNIPHDSVPAGTTDDDDKHLHMWGKPPSFSFEARDHLDLGEALDIIDVERASRASGSRFWYLKREAAILELALARFAMDRVAAHGFVPTITPAMVRREVLEGQGGLMAGEEQVYRLEADDLYLIATSEVALAAYHQSEMLDPSTLPLRYAGFSSCFRREAGTYGKDTRGIFRVHQFEKVEMFSYTTPEASWDEHDFMLKREEEILQALEIPYRVAILAAGNTYGPSAKTYDVEAWFPGQGQYRELTSCSNCTDYQARRLNVRFKADGGTTFVHTLNGTAVAVQRTIAALLENHQRADGSIAIPKALRPYCGFDSIGPR